MEWYEELIIALTREFGLNFKSETTNRNEFVLSFLFLEEKGIKIEVNKSTESIILVSPQDRIYFKKNEFQEMLEEIEKIE